MNNAALIILYRFFWMFIPVISVFLPLMSTYNFTMTEFFLIQSVFGLTVVIFEVPSGYMADLYGRKRTLIIGSILSGLGFTYLYFARSLYEFYLYEVIIGMAMAMSTGTDFAILFDSVNEDLKDSSGKYKCSKKEVEKITTFWVSHFQSAAMVGEAVSSFLGGFLALYSMSYNLIATAISGWAPLCVAIFVKEPEIKRMSHGSHMKNFTRIFKHLFVDSVFMCLLMINFIIWSMSTMCAVWLIQKYWLDTNLSVFYFGCLWASLSLIGSVFSRYAFNIEKFFGLKRCFMFFALLTVSAYIFLPFANFLGSLVLVAFFYASRGVQSVIYREEVNLRLEPEFRATANSIYSLFFRLIFMVLGPLMGAFVDFSSVESMFTVLGLFYTFLLLLALLPFLERIDENRHF